MSGDAQRREERDAWLDEPRWLFDDSVHSGVPESLRRAVSRVLTTAPQPRPSVLRTASRRDGDIELASGVHVLCLEQSVDHARVVVVVVVVVVAPLCVRGERKQCRGSGDVGPAVEGSSAPAAGNSSSGATATFGFRRVALRRRCGVAAAGGNTADFAVGEDGSAPGG